MKVNLKAASNSAAGCFPAGSRDVDLPDNEALALIDAGFAEKSESVSLSPPVNTVESFDDDESEAETATVEPGETTMMDRGRPKRRGR